MDAEMKERLTRKRLCEYILDGEENSVFDARPPEARREEAQRKIYKVLNASFERGEDGPEGDIVLEAASEIENAGFELGVQAGARTLAALLFD